MCFSLLLNFKNGQNTVSNKTPKAKNVLTSEGFLRADECFMVSD